MANQFTSRKLEFVDLGLINFNDSWNLQKALFEARHAKKICDTLLFVEHSHTYTLGKSADENNLILSEEGLRENKISVYNIDRGGDITYHGPGQVVGYPIIGLSDWKEDTHLYLRNLEQVIINVCSSFGLEGSRIEGLTGVWVNERKIAAIGIKVSRWITMHGFAFNINTDLDYFDGIIPCGIKDKDVTSLSRELNREVTPGEVKKLILDEFVRLFDYTDLRILDNEQFRELNEIEK